MCFSKWGGVCLLSGLSSCLLAGEVDFARDVQPILSENCYACHGPDGEERAAGLRLDTAEGMAAVVSAGDPGRSELLARVSARDPEDRMPPQDKKDRLDADEVAILSRWIEAGAKWGRHWAFEAPLRPEVPERTERPGSSGGETEEHPIDAFVAFELDRHGLERSPPAPREWLLRRAFLDLTGLPPTVSELDGFLADESPDAYEKAVDVLLASSHYGERWARWWMDAGRYADSNGYEKDSTRFVWPYRDWLIQAFNRNEAYDSFLIRQIAGDLLKDASLDDRVATGFLRNGMVNEEGAIDAEQFRVEGIFDRLDAIGKSVLGLTTQCAQCHTHKYDPLTHEEYFGMFAFLNNAYEATVPYYTPAQRTKIAGLEAELAGLREELRESLPDWEERFEGWVRGHRERIQSAPEWHTVTPDHLGDGGQKFYALEDGSIITMGFAPARSTERFAGLSPVDEIASVRIELLMHPYLTYGGPGRSLEGTAAVSEFRLFAGTDPDDLKPVALKSAVSDWDPPARPLDAVQYPNRNDAKDDRTEGPAAFINDGDVKTAWATEAGWDRSNQPRVVVMDLESPLRSDEGAPLHLRFEVLCQHGGWNSDGNHHRNLGRFRFSFSGDSFGASPPVSPRLREILEKPSGAWTDAEREMLFDAWMEEEPAATTPFAKSQSIRERHPAPTPQLVLQERAQPRETRLFHRGEQHDPRQVVRAHVPAFLHDLPEGSDPESRLSFARWLADSTSPTTARAWVNRTWQTFFGAGIVESVEDLGHQATRPSHPELLDWLAVEFVESGWDMKHIHRLIVTSRTYRQHSAVSPERHGEDPRNRLLARGSRFRPDAEVVRDIQLAASGLLQREIGGESVRPPAPRFLFDPPASYSPKPWPEDTEPERRYRRALYTFRYRTVPPPFLATFDAPSGEISCVRRPRSTTPLQALALLNEPLSFEAAQALARQIEAGAGDLEGSFILAFRQCTSRTPDASELQILLDLYEAEQATGGDPSLAVARVLLNLDETITRP